MKKENEDKGEEKMRALKAACEAITRQFGKGALMLLGDKPGGGQVDTFSTGSLSLDLALGIGGYPKGRLIEIFGPEASGKTTFTLHAIAACQRQGGIAAFIDAEHALDTTYAARLGVDPGKILLSQPDHGEQALEIAETLARSGAVDLIVIDSVAALVPKAEIEGEMGDQHVGLQARLMSQAMRKLTAVTARQGTTVIFINQIRMKIGVMFGSPETTTGGNALKFYASVRIEVRRGSALKDGEKIIGNQTHVKVVKNKLAPPFRNVDVELRYGTGVCQEAELLDLGVLHGCVSRSGNWFNVGQERLGQGRAQAMEFLSDAANAGLAARLRTSIIDAAAAAGGGAVGAAA
jgi:recombination protein RecA